MEDFAKQVTSAKESSIKFIKSRIFDVIAVGIIVAMTVLSLGVLELREITPKELVNIIIENVPFFLATMMLSTNYYNKGTFTGKFTTKFIDTVKYYSGYVEGFTGHQIDVLPEFCKYYNDKALKRIKEELLRSVAIPWSKYDEGDDDTPPLKTLTYNTLCTMYDKHIAKTIIKCNKLKVKGINVNVLLSNIDSSDPTYLGKTEQQMARQRKVSYSITYLFFTVVMALIGVKNFLEWGWVGLLFTVFKLLYICCSSYMKYFQGYEDICTGLVNHIYRKTDILKEFNHWYTIHHSKTITESKK